MTRAKNTCKCGKPTMTDLCCTCRARQKAKEEYTRVWDHRNRPTEQ